MRRIALFLLVSFAASAALADAPPRISLTVLPSTTLPGLPVAFLLDISNPSAQPQMLSDLATLEVSTPNGTFSAVNLRGDTAIHLPADQTEPCGVLRCITIPGNGSRQIYVRFGPLLAENEFFADRRLSMPGRYDVTVKLSLASPSGSGGAGIASEAQTLVVQQPSGPDAAVWNLLEQLSGGKGWTTRDWIESGDTVARQIRAAGPASAYVSWVAGIGTLPDTPPSAKLAQLESALTNNVPGALHDELLYEEGGILAGLSHTALYSQRDADAAVALATRARAVLSALQESAQTAYMRAQATDALSKLVTRDTALAAIRSLADHDAPAPLPLVPRVECVRRDGGRSFTARFGYSNPNHALKVLQIGADNQVTPAPRETGQPRVFQPGTHANVFMAASPGGLLTWHLDGNTATATADFPTPCPP